MQGKTRNRTVQRRILRVMQNVSESKRRTELNGIAEKLYSENRKKCADAAQRRRQKLMVLKIFPQHIRKKRRKQNVIDPDQTGKAVQCTEKSRITIFSGHDKNKIKTRHNQK